jgi:hypothetical protein
MFIRVTRRFPRRLSLPGLPCPERLFVRYFAAGGPAWTSPATHRSSAFSPAHHGPHDYAPLGYAAGRRLDGHPDGDGRT